MQLELASVLLAWNLGQSWPVVGFANLGKCHRLDGEPDRGHRGLSAEPSQFRTSPPALDSRAGPTLSRAINLRRRFRPFLHVPAGETFDPFWFDLVHVLDSSARSQFGWASATFLGFRSSEAITAIASVPITTPSEAPTETCSHGSTTILPPMKIRTRARAIFR